MHRIFTVVRLCGVIVLLLLAPLSFAADGGIVIVVDEENAVHRLFLDGFVAQMQRVNAETTLQYLLPARVQEERPALSGAKLVVTVGLRAALKFRELDLAVPTIQSLVSNNDQGVLQDEAGSDNISSLYLDQPPIRTLALVKAALPGRRAVTVGLGESSRRLGEKVTAACARLGLECTEAFMRDSAELEDAMESAAHSDHVLVIFPDPLVVNPANAKALILGAFMRGIALVGYSQALVKAGALMAVHSTPEQLGVDTANMVHDALASHPFRLPPSRYPELFSVSVNYQLARALRLHMPSEGALTQTVRRAGQ